MNRIIVLIITLCLIGCSPAQVIPTEIPAEQVIVTSTPLHTYTIIPTIENTATPTLIPATETPAPTPTAAIAQPGKAIKMVLLPKFLPLDFFSMANRGAQKAAVELKNQGTLQFVGPTNGDFVAGQINIINKSVANGWNAIMISNVAGDEIVPAVKEARSKGVTVVTWDASIPSGEGEQVYIAPVDFDSTGKALADLALDVIGEGGGKFAILSSSPGESQESWINSLKMVMLDSKYSKLELMEVVYGNEDPDLYYQLALEMVKKYPDLKLILSPTVSGLAAAAKAIQSKGLCEKIKVTGCGIPGVLASYVKTKNGCVPKFMLWSFVDLGYLTYFTTYLLATGSIKGMEGERFQAGRMGEYTIEKDPTRSNGLRVLMGPFKIYDKDNIDQAIN